MIFAAILAGGQGVRMGAVEKPKQYLDLGGKPILVHTVEKFFIMPEFDRIIVLCPESMIEPTKDILVKAFGPNERMIVIAGGKDRNETVRNALNHIDQYYGIDDETVICTHDSVRPFVTYRIIKDNLSAMNQYVACDTVVPAVDTIVESEDGVTINSIPARSNLYQGQTPQTFKAAKLKELQDSLSREELSLLTDACKIFVMRNEKVALVKGEAFNLKVTYSSDLKIANALLEE